MRNLHTFALPGLAALAVGVLPRVACADVTIQQQTTFDLAIIKAHGTTTESTTADKQRRDTEFHCEGFMSLLCGNAQSDEILRLDRDVRWTLDPKKKEYRETPFPTLAQRQAAQQQAKEMMEKMRQCPAPQNSAPAPDTSKCEMSSPTFEVKATDTHAMFAGHDAKLTQLAMTQSCKNKETGDVCEFMIALDSWLTQDQIAGVDEDKTFRSAYLKKLGRDEGNELVQQQMKQFLASYQDALKQIASKSGDLKGYPLKTTVRIAFGGEHCGAAKGQSASAGAGGNPVADAGQAAGDAATNASANAAGAAAATAAGNAAGNNAGGSILSSAANAFGSKLVGGLFSKKKTPDAPAATATPPSASLPPGMLQAAQFTVETTSISAGPVPGTQFDVPADYKLVAPKERAAKEFSCPKTGS
jgi:hypothetical protein